MSKKIIIVGGGIAGNHDGSIRGDELVAQCRPALAVIYPESLDLDIVVPIAGNKFVVFRRGYFVRDGSVSLGIIGLETADPDLPVLFVSQLYMPRHRRQAFRPVGFELAFSARDQRRKHQVRIADGVVRMQMG